MKILNKKLFYVLVVIIVIGISVYVYYKTLNNQPYTPPPIIASSTSTLVGVDIIPGVGMVTSSQGPIDLIVTDPNGFTITPTTTVPSDEEYLREIPGVLYYSEMEKGFDGNPIDRVYSYVAKTGDYIIKVIPNSDVLPTSIYILGFSIGNQIITLAKNTPINQIPPQGYGVHVTQNGSLITIIPFYTNTQFGFKFEYPEGWTFHENIFGSPFSKFNLTGASPEEKGIPNPVISSFLVNIVTSDFVEKSFYDLKGVNVIVAGVSGKKYEFEFEGISEISIILPFGEYRMILAATKKYEDIFNQILASFKFLK